MLELFWKVIARWFIYATCDYIGRKPENQELGPLFAIRQTISSYNDGLRNRELLDQMFFFIKRNPKKVLEYTVKKFIGYKYSSTS